MQWSAMRVSLLMWSPGRNRDHPRAKIEHFLRTSSAVIQNHRENTCGLPEIQNLFGRFCVSGNFYSRHLEHAHPGILAFLERSELRSYKWHLSGPELIAEALKYKKMLKFMHSHVLAQRGSTMVPKYHRGLTLWRAARLKVHLITFAMIL